MGRWVTSKGRRIYIPDEGEENPYAKEKIKPYYVDQETQILDRKMSSRGKMIYAKSEEEALSQYKKEYPKGNPRIKESKYPEHIKRAQELNKEESAKQKQIAENKEQADERNTTYLNNDISKEEQAYMNAKAIKISKNMPKEKQAELRKLKAAYNKDYKEEKAKRLASSGGKKQSRMDKGDWEERVDSLYAKYSKKFSVDPNSWLQYGEEGKAAYRQYKEAVNKVEPNKRKRARYFRDRREF